MGQNQDEMPSMISWLYLAAVYVAAAVSRFVRRAKASDDDDVEGWRDSWAGASWAFDMAALRGSGGARRLLVTWPFRFSVTFATGDCASPRASPRVVPSSIAYEHTTSEGRGRRIVVSDIADGPTAVAVNIAGSPGRSVRGRRVIHATYRTEGGRQQDLVEFFNARLDSICAPQGVPAEALMASLVGRGVLPDQRGRDGGHFSVVLSDLAEARFGMDENVHW